MREGVCNATIDSTFLGVEDHGILILMIDLDYGDGAHQGYQRQVTPQRLRDVLKVAGVESWEHLRGRSVRVRTAGSRIGALGHIIRDEWTDSDEAKAGGDA